ncbi:MAG: sigma-70 family RNA polymerase sigma factor [Chloroflexota bacterium]|nr:sigma-70 family RNA polymerase sigma factor [Chloroflexota bacterium]
MEIRRLVALAKAGDVDAFTVLVQRYQAMVFGYAYATTGDFDLAEDASQQAFITAWRNLAHLTHPERFGGWLRGIVRFECLHLLRARHAVHLPIDDVPGIVSTSPGPVELTEANESLDRALAAIAALPEAERVSAILFYIHDHTQREVAEFLNLPVSTVNNRLRNARKHLREGGFVPMAKDALQAHTLPKDFAARIGEVVRSHGLIIDARFGATQRPPILNEVTVTDHDSGLALTALVAQYLDDDLVRCFAMSDPVPNSISLRPGLTIRDMATPISVPMDAAALIDVVGRMRGADPRNDLLETGIKAIDVFCPLPAGGVIGLVGDMQTGKMVLVEELIHRLDNLSRPLSILVFVEAPMEVKVVQQLDYCTSGSVKAIYLPVADASPEALAPILDRLDAVITLSRRLGEQRFYPAIDPLRSTSRLLNTDIVGHEHVDVAASARDLLNQAASPDGAEAARAQAAKLQRYLTQPFFVAEAFTNRPGVAVPRDVAIADVRVLLDDHQAGISDDKLYMIGALGNGKADA